MSKKTKIPTVRRAAWHRKCDRWQIQNPTGQLWSTFGKRKPSLLCGLWATGATCAECAKNRSRWFSNMGPKRKPPKDHRKTLRRIVDARKKHNETETP